MKRQVISVIIVVALLVVAAMGCKPAPESTPPTEEALSRIFGESFQDQRKAWQALNEEFKDSSVVDGVEVNLDFPKPDDRGPVVHVNIILKEGITPPDHDQKNQIRETVKRLVLEKFRVRPTIDVKLIGSVLATTLMEAVQWRSTEMVQAMLAKGADVNGKDDSGWTALMWAAMGGYTDMVKVLLANGANIDEQDPNGNTALMVAAMWGRTYIVKVLLENGADVQLRDIEGRTALTWTKKEEIIQMLKEAGARE